MKAAIHLVSIIMPAYNCENYVAVAITSVIGQTYTNWELLITDDASNDKTYDVISSFDDSRIRVTRNPVNLGNITTRNNLCLIANGDFLTILDADDFMSTRRLEEQVNAFIADSELKACFTNYFEVFADGRHSIRHNLKTDYYLNQDNFESSFHSMPATIMLKREVYQKIGGLHIYFDRLFAEDKYWVYCIIDQFKVVLLMSPLYYYRANPNSLTNLFDNPRKLTVVELVNELIRQRKSTGTDWLSDGRETDALEYESKLLNNQRWLSEQYRIFAARQIDLLKKHEAFGLLRNAFRTAPFNLSIARTAFYFLRKFYL